MAARNTTKQEKEIYSKLDNIKDNSIYEWLDNIKLNGTDAQSKVVNPLSGSKIFTNKEGIYPIIIKWCFENFKGYDFTGVPNAQNILSNMAASTSLVASSASSAAKAKSPDIDILLIAKEWKDNPMINPLTGATIQVSINPKSEYVALYAKLIDKLVKHLLQNGKKILTIQDCKTIKDSMPNMHAIYHITDGNNNIIDSIFYDHLFMTKFITLKESKSANKYSYDNDYLKEIEPYIYLNMYKAIIVSLKKSHITTYDNIADLLIYIEPINTHFSIGILVEKLCSDIKNVLYMHESKITEEKINTAIYNKEVLKYYIKIYQLTLTNLDLRKEIINYYNNYAKYNMSYNADRKNKLNNTNYIYYQISNHVSKDDSICKTLLSVYDCILKLYSDNNMKNTEYKYIKDPFNTNKGVEPQLPRKPQLPQDLQKYKMLSSLSGAVKNEEKELALQEYQEKDKEWKNQIEEYEKKKDIYDRIYEGKFSPKQRKGVWKGLPLNIEMRAKDDVIIKATKALTAKHSKKVLKAFTTSSHINKENSSSSQVPKVSFVKFDKVTKTFIIKLDKSAKVDKEDYYVNDADPNTLEDFEDMHPNKQKYTCDIVYYNENNRDFHLRFDTVNIYNYILKCIEYCEKPINPITKAELTNENLDEICNKIKYFTKKPTYNSSLDIRALLDNCKYDNLLAFDYTINYLQQRTSNPIIGRLYLYLNISLGGILFRVMNNLYQDVNAPDNYPNQTNPVNSVVLTLPVFADYISDIYDEANYTHPVYILSDLQQKIPKGNIMGNRYFPYRKNNADGQQWKPVVKLPNFDLNVLDDADVAFAKLKDYKDKIDNL
jgi:hypothetical protein